tara:strand:+ start:465 stop:749 length:285 start_codon:yes stop_codon:yes gene_type:complete
MSRAQESRLTKIARGQVSQQLHISLLDVVDDETERALRYAGGRLDSGELTTNDAVATIARVHALHRLLDRFESDIKQALIASEEEFHGEKRKAG